jgi:tetratricopeptide (TPR) repeat protein
LIAAGGLALARHDFETALQFGERAVARAPARPAAHGVLIDALVELGRYEEAVAAAQRMVDLRPDLASFTRVAYLRELHGDVDGAISAMRRAIQAGPPSGEATAWCEVQLGHLHFLIGDVEAAERAYASALERLPGYAHATAGLARVRAARGDLAGAAELYARAAERLPLPDFVTELAAVYELLGDAARARQQRDLLEAMRRLLSANGVRADADLALFHADHGIDLQRAVEVAREEHARRPSVRVADALAWAEYRNGDLENALRHSHEALRLGTRDPLMLYHAGVIAQAAGDLDRAYGLLAQSFEMNPRFSTLWADDLASRLGELRASRGAP